MNILSNLSAEMILPVFPSLLGGVNASRMRLQTAHPLRLSTLEQNKSERLNQLLDRQDQASQVEAEDLEEYLTYVHTLRRSVDGSRGIPILHVAEAWYSFCEAYLDLSFQPSHLVVPYLDAKMTELDTLLNNLGTALQNPNLELSERIMEHEDAIWAANKARMQLVASLLAENDPTFELQNMARREDKVENTRVDIQFPDFCQARLMTAHQFNQAVHNLNLVPTA